MSNFINRFAIWLGALAGILVIGATAPTLAQRANRGPEVRVAAPSGVVNLNTATAAELTRLPGVGPQKARAILALRERMQRFRRVEDILRVRGIGRTTFRRLRPMLTLTGNTTLAPPQRPQRRSGSNGSSR
jgi:competence protein ComEA